MDSELFNEYKAYYRELHDQGKFSGGSLKAKYIPQIKALVQKTGSRTLLDFGCGKAHNYTKSHINRAFGIKDGNVSLYDPGYEQYEDMPEGQFDCLICTDVMEHIPEELIDETLQTMFSKCTKFAFIVIHCGLADKVLPNGENAHITVKPPDWWKQKIIENKGLQMVQLKFIIPSDPKKNILGL